MNGRYGSHCSLDRLADVGRAPTGTELLDAAVNNGELATGELTGTG